MIFFLLTFFVDLTLFFLSFTLFLSFSLTHHSKMLSSVVRRQSGGLVATLMRSSSAASRGFAAAAEEQVRELFVFLLLDGPIQRFFQQRPFLSRASRAALPMTPETRHRSLIVSPLRDGNQGGTSRGLKLPPNWLAILLERGKTLTLVSFVFFFATTPFLSQPPLFLSFSVSFLLFFFHSLSLSLSSLRTWSSSAAGPGATSRPSRRGSSG